MLVYGHRGAAGEAPENTVAGCLHALERGARFVEVDLRLSADEQLVVIHDSNLQRTAGKAGFVRNFTARELSRVDCRADGPPWPRKRDCGVPTLDTLLDATARMRGYQLEVKSDSNAVMRKVAKLLSDRFPTPAAARKVVVTSSNYHLHEYLGDLAPHITRGVVLLQHKALADMAQLGCSYCALHWTACNPLVIGSLRNSGVHASVWTVNEPNMIKAMHTMHVDSIITDYPSMALPLVASLQR